MKSKIRLAFFLLVLISVTTYSNAQLPMRDFNFSHLKTEQGLSSGLLNELYRDKEGFLWIGTFNGLDCFDGSHFKVWTYNPINSSGLPNNVIESICEDKNGNIWCATDASASRYNKFSNSFTNYKLVNSVTGETEVFKIFEIACCRNGNIVINSCDGIFIFDSVQNKFIHYPELPSGRMTSEIINKNGLIEDPFQNGLWLGTSAGLKYFDMDKKIYLSYKNNPGQLPIYNEHYITPVTLDKNNRLVFGDYTTQEIVTYDLSTHEIIHESTEKWNEGKFYIATIFIDHDNNKWISTWTYKLFFSEAKTGNTFRFKHNGENSYSVNADFFWHAIQDDDGTIYIATIDGISKTNLNKDFFSITTLPDTIDHHTQYFSSLVMGYDYQKNIWLTPNFKYALRYNSVDQTYKKFDFKDCDKTGFRNGEKVSCMQPSQEKLYFGTSNGIYILDVKTETMSPLKNYLPYDTAAHREVRVMKLTKNNELWFAATDGGLYCYNIITHEFHSYFHNAHDPHSISKYFITCMHDDLNGDIWLGADEDQLIKFNRKKNNFDYAGKSKKINFPLGEILAIKNDSKNNLWVMNNLLGVMKYDPVHETLDTTIQAKGSTRLILGGMEMHDDKLWIKYYSNYYIYNTVDSTIESFDIDFSKKNYAYVNGIFDTPEGNIISESRNAFIELFPRAFNFPLKDEPVTISNFTADKINYSFLNNRNEIRLRYFENFFSIDFSTLSFYKDNNLLFAYKLDGVDKDWVYCGKRQTAYYTNISGGNYSFNVKYRNSSGKWIESIRPVSIHISKLFYYTLWFRILLIVCLMLCIWWYASILKKRSIKKESAKAINYFANSILEKNKVEDILWDITHNVITRTDLVDCVIYLLDSERNVLIQKAAFGDKNPEAYNISNAIELPVGKGIVGSVAVSGKTEIVNDTSKDERYIVDDESRLSEIAVPLLHDGNIIGVIDSEHPRKNFFKRDHVQILETIASICSSKIAASIEKERAETHQHELLEVSKKIAELRLTALQAQMNPHFIFNCLNVIDHYILKHDSEKASHYLNQFAKLIRQILNQSSKNSITLAEEIKWLNIYTELEKLNIENGFEFIINTSPDINLNEIEIPPLLIQPFVENAIIHGLAPKKGEKKLSLHIKMNAGILQCIVEDNGIGRAAAMENKRKKTDGYQSKGLEVTEERINILKTRIHENSSIEFHDLMDENGNAAGTRVVINIPIEL